MTQEVKKAHPYQELVVPLGEVFEVGSSVSLLRIVTEFDLTHSNGLELLYEERYSLINRRDYQEGDIGPIKVTCRFRPIEVGEHYVGLDVTTRQSNNKCMGGYFEESSTCFKYKVRVIRSPKNKQEYLI